MKKCLVLLAALLVGVGVLGGRADAASIFSVTVTTPADSGAFRGIDSSFVITAKVVDFTPVDSLEVVMYLAINDSTVVSDAVGSAFVTSAAGVSLSQPSVILIGQNKNPLTARATTTNLTIRSLRDGQSSARLEGSNLVAVQQKRGRNKPTGSAVALSTAHRGDGDSVAVSISGDTTIYKWYGKVVVSSGTMSLVRAGVLAVDDNGAGSTAGSANSAFNDPIDTTDVVLSPANKLFTVDGDRPGNPTELVNKSATTLFVTSGTTVGGLTAGGFTRGNTTVLGIGDSIKVDIRLGGQATPVLSGDSLNVVAAYFSKLFTLSKTSRSADTLQHRLGLTEGMFGNLLETSIGADADTTSVLSVYIVDRAGNRSGATVDAAASGVTAAANFLVDTKRPDLDNQTVTADTILPVSGDTISDGTFHDDINTTFTYPDDGAGPRADEVLSWVLPEALDSLVITFDGSTADATVVVNSRTAGNPQRNNANLGTTASGGTGATYAANGRVLDFTRIGNRGVSDTLRVGTTAGASVTFFSAAIGNGRAARNSDSLRTGLHTITFQATDLAGNMGSTALSRTNVYIDVDDITLLRLFPTDAAGLDTIEETTSRLIFRLSEPADSVVITYYGDSGPDAGKTRTRRLSGTSLTNTTTEQDLPVDSLKSGTKYVLSVLARDLAGNFTRSTPDTFLYDTAFVVPVLAKFAIAVNTAKKGFGAPILAGDTLTLNLTAQTAASKDAVTYKRSAILKVTGSGGSNHGITLVSGTGATDAGNGRITLNADDWVTGKRSVIIKDTSSVDTLRISIVDSSNAASPYTGTLDSSVVINPQTYAKIRVSAADSVTQGEQFWVNVWLLDTFGNTRVKDNRYVAISANKLGVGVPVGSVYIESGVGGFWANSEGWSGAGLEFRVRDVLTSQANGHLNGITAANVGDNFIHGKSNAIYVRAATGGGAVAALDAPNRLHAGDYLGADGAGDQGGFVMLTFDQSADHETLTSYRIWREILVDWDVNAADSLVQLTEPASTLIPWAKVDAVPGVEGAMHVVVATLDNVATLWVVSAERGRETTAKQAFVSAAAVASPYELMAQTMMRSKQAAKANGPLFATLTPEALAFTEKGIVPRMKDTLPVVLQSSKVYTQDRVRAIDNIAPTPVSGIRVIDTPNDAGGSITASWTKSESDRMLPRMIASAVGPTTSDMVEGVKGYNVYRKSGRGEFALVGQTGPGEPSFVDATVFNGERYTYKVSPYDEDNVSPASGERTAMAIRNRVFDRAGALVLGLFGVDSRVGFDDFFILADRFGLTAADEGFDPAFDLRADNKVDFDDFFVFADNFGKTIEGAGKVVPVLAGLNSDARLDLIAGATLPRIGEELAVEVDLADFVEVKGYGFSLSYDPTVLEFVKVASENSMLGEAELARPMMVSQVEGTVSIAAFGQTATQGDLGVSLIFRTKAEIENSYIDLTEGELHDGSYGLNQVASLGAVQVQTRPEVYNLADNYPNPFNPETTIKYQLPEAADVRLDVYNVVGQVVRTLVTEHQNAGRYVVQWDAANDNGQPLSSGIYFYHIQAGEFQKTKKMLLLK